MEGGGGQLAEGGCNASCVKCHKQESQGCAKASVALLKPFDLAGEDRRVRQKPSRAAGEEKEAD